MLSVGLALAAVALTQTRPLLDEEFSGKRLDTRVWSTCHWWAPRGGCTIASNHELEWYVPSQVGVRRGVLSLTAARRAVRGSDGRDHPFVSGMISSGPRSEGRRPGFAFRYGRAEFRARIPAGRGLWPALWLLPASRASTPEIDVMEAVGQRPRTVEMHLHADGGVRGGSFHRLTPGWHRFAIDWRPGRLKWLVDGVERFHVTGAAVPSQSMYLVADLAVGGDWPGPPDAATRFPSALELDYVRVTR